MVKAVLDDDDASILSLAFIRELFPRPEEDDDLLFDMPSGSGLILYFSKPYYEDLLKAMKDSKRDGRFARSNAEEDWETLLKKVESAEEINDVDKSNLEEYTVL